MKKKIDDECVILKKDDLYVIFINIERDIQSILRHLNAEEISSAAFQLGKIQNHLDEIWQKEDEEDCYD